MPNKMFVNLNRSTGSSSNTLPITTTTTTATATTAANTISSSSSSSSDMLYTEIRDLSIELIGFNLRQKAQAIKTSYSSFRDNKDATISDIHNFIKKIPNLTSKYKSLNLHINMTTHIKQIIDNIDFQEFWQTERGIVEGDNVYEQLEEFLYADVYRIGFYHILRLICLLSVVSNGLRYSRYEVFKKLMVQTYGFENIFILTNLEKSGRCGG
jgi:hypothetical protein